jgi:hypothetical protein
MSEQDLGQSVQELRAQMAQMRAELNTLRASAQVLPQAVQPAKGGVSTSRRKALLGLAGGLVGGIGMVGLAGAVPPDAEAKVSVKAGRIGAIMTPTGDAAINDLPVGTTFKYGLVALSGTGNFDLSVPANLFEFNTGVFASGSTAGVYGKGGSFGVSGKGFYGVQGDGTDTGVIGSGDIAGGQFIGGNGGGFGAAATAGFGFISGNLPANSSIGLIATGGVNVSLDNLFANNQNVGLYASAGNVFGRNPTAGYFQGTVAVVGSLSKSAGSFKIDHPLDPSNKYLYHSFVESPDMLNIYNGMATLNEAGEAEVEMPDWFEALNRDYRYQLTCIGEYAPVFIAEKIRERKFKIGGGQPRQEISWQVTGIRKDAYAKAHPIPVEEVKGEGEKGKFLHPELFGE